MEDSSRSSFSLFGGDITGIEVSEAFVSKLIENISLLAQVLPFGSLVMKSLQEQSDELKEKLKKHQQDVKRGSVVGGGVRAHHTNLNMRFDLPRAAVPQYTKEQKELMELAKGNLMDELNDVQEDGVVYADDQQYEVDENKCDNGYVTCPSSYDCTSRYTGQWKNRMPHGRGTIIVEWKDKNSKALVTILRYDGMWKNGVPCGRGRTICIHVPDRKSNQLIEGEFDERGLFAAGCLRYCLNGMIQYCEGDYKWVQIKKSK